MHNQLLKDLETIKAKYTESGSQTQIDGWMRRAKDAMIVNSLKEHEGIKIIIENCEKEIAQINNILLNARGYPEGKLYGKEINPKYVSSYDRELLLDRRAMYEQFLSIFAEADQTIKSITSQVEENL